jgi:hypothetical protein
VHDLEDYFVLEHLVLAKTATVSLKRWIHVNCTGWKDEAVAEMDQKDAHFSRNQPKYSDSCSANWSMKSWWKYHTENHCSHCRKILLDVAVGCFLHSPHYEEAQSV